MFEPPGGELPEQILLPVPTKRTKGVLVFPTLDGTRRSDGARPGGTARTGRSVTRRGGDHAQGGRDAPGLEGAEPIAAYAGLRPAAATGRTTRSAPRAPAEA